MGSDIVLRASDLIAGAKTHLAYLDSALSTAPGAAMQRATAALQRSVMMLGQTGVRRLAPELSRLTATGHAIATAAATAIARATDRLDSRRSLLEALSPAATLARGYSITTGADGRAIRSASALKPGEQVVTTLADGFFTSTVNK